MNSNIFYLIKIKSGSTIDAKTYPDVTMLFSDIVGFTSICSRATPFMVISMLEELYKDFDEACGYFDVYKVETIGDAYCVASGLHRPGSFDAHKVAWMALRMMDACSRHITHDGQPIRVSNLKQQMEHFSTITIFFFFQNGIETTDAHWNTHWHRFGWSCWP